MKIILTVDQMKKILASEPVHLPIIIKMEKVSKKEFQELSAIIKDNRKDYLVVNLMPLNNSL